MNTGLQKSIKKNKEQTRRERIALFAGILCLMLAFSVYFLSQREDIQRKFIYPYPYQEITLKYAEKYGVDSSLVAGVIMSESKFNHKVHSDKGAVGLMQLMPETAQSISENLGEGICTEEELHEPDRNIRYGTWYLSSLAEEFQGNEVLMLAAYNAGRGNVHSWMEEYGWEYDFSSIDEIPFSETKGYVRDVLNNQAKYKQLYRENTSE